MGVPSGRLLYEYGVPGGVLTLDAEPWEPLALRRGALPFWLHKPRCDDFACPDRPDVRTTFQIEVRGPAADPPAGPDFVPWVIGCMTWIGVVTNQAASGMATGAGPIQGRMSSTEGPASGFGVYPLGISGEPLTRESWAAIGVELGKGLLPRLCDLLFADALRAIRERSLPRAILLLGVAAEQEVSLLVGDLRARADAASKSAWRRRRPRGFRCKLKQAPLLGAEPFIGGRATAVEDICELYERRGTVAHTGVFEPEAATRLPGFVFAFEDLREWARTPRAHLGIPQPAPRPIRLRHLVL